MSLISCSIAHVSGHRFTFSYFNIVFVFLGIPTGRNTMLMVKRDTDEGALLNTTLLGAIRAIRR